MSVVDHLSGTTIDTSASTNNSVPEVAPISVVDGFTVSLGVSNHHVHLAQAELDALFGKGYELTKMKDLSQPGQFAAKECVILAGPKGVIQKVRILGPVRPETQVEIFASDQFKLGIKAPLRLSGDLKDTPGITLVGSQGSVQIPRGVIIAQRHIHMTLDDAARYGVVDKQVVSLEMPGDRGGILRNVIIRANNSSAFECHLDTEEANAMGVSGKDKLRLIK
ncbi:phosphate propanoyltransferase [Lactococcus lactis]